MPSVGGMDGQVPADDECLRRRRSTSGAEVATVPVLPLS
jgi:hypothetical protein